MQASRNERSDGPWALGMMRRRHRPKPLGLRISTATATRVLPAAPLSPLSGLDATDESLIDLNHPGELIMVWPHHGRAEAVQHGPSRLIGTEPEKPVQGLGRNPVLRRSGAPSSLEPDRQRGAGAVENRPGCHGYPSPTARAPEPPVAHPPMAGHPALRANETARPAKPLQIIETRGIIGKPCPHLLVVGRIVVPSFEARGWWLRRKRSPKRL